MNGLRVARLSLPGVQHERQQRNAGHDALAEQLRELFDRGARFRHRRLDFGNSRVYQRNRFRELSGNQIDPASEITSAQIDNNPEFWGTETPCVKRI